MSLLAGLKLSAAKPKSIAQPSHGSSAATGALSASVNDTHTDPSVSNPTLIHNTTEDVAHVDVVVGGRTDGDAVEFLGASDLIVTNQLVNSQDAPSKNKKRKGSNRRPAAIDVSESSSASWEECSMVDFKERFVSFNNHAENRLLKAIQDELELKRKLEELQIEKETLETSKKTLDQALTNLQNDHVNSITRISDLEKQALEKDNNFAALQKEADEAKSRLTQALKDLEREKSFHQISCTTAVLDYKASQKGHKEVELIMHPVMHYFYTLGAEDSSAANGDLAKLNHAEYYAPGQDTEIDIRFDDWKAGADMISKYAPDSIEENSSI